MTYDPNVTLVILALFGVGVIGIVQTLKTILKLDGTKALILTGLVSFGATGFYFSQAPPFNLLAFFIYGLAVFVEASGLYKVVMASGK